MSKKAIVIIDMLNDFVSGSLKCDRAQRIIRPLQTLLASARSKGLPVIYSNDCHYKGIDNELKLWGEHAIRGTAGADVINELTPADGDYVVPKEDTAVFFQTDLHLLLRELEVDTLIMTGLHVNMCVRHTPPMRFSGGFK